MELYSVGLLILQLLSSTNFLQHFQVLLRNARLEILELVVGLTLSLCIHLFLVSVVLSPKMVLAGKWKGNTALG